MALTNQIDALAEDIVPASPGETPEQDTAREEAVVNVKNLLDKIMPHIQDNGEITTSLDSPLASLFSPAVPIPTDGGAAINTAYNANAAAHPNSSTGNIA